MITAKLTKSLIQNSQLTRKSGVQNYEYYLITKKKFNGFMLVLKVLIVVFRERMPIGLLIKVFDNKKY